MYLVQVDVDLDPLCVGVVDHGAHRGEFRRIDDKVARLVMPTVCSIKHKKEKFKISGVQAVGMACMHMAKKTRTTLATVNVPAALDHAYTLYPCADEHTPAVHSGTARPARVYANAVVPKVKERSERPNSAHSVTPSDQSIHLVFV